MAATFRILLDTPSDRPVLGFPESARALADIVQRSRPQFAVGVFGSWGSGKTTMMDEIERNLDRERCVVVRFNAWRYEREEHLVVPLLECVREGIAEWAAMYAHHGGQSAREVAMKMGRLIAALLRAFSAKIGLPGSLEISFEADKVAAALEKKPETIERSIYHGAFTELRKAFDAFPSNDVRIVIFVDDLDRCLPTAALEVLESMKLFFDLPGFVFVVGLDRAVIERCVEYKYAAQAVQTSAKLPISGPEYVRKIFQVPYALAPVHVAQLDQLVNSIEIQANLPQEQKDDLRMNVLPHLRYLVSDGIVNPREIKRFINAYVVAIKTRPALRREIFLALNVIAFRPDWAQVHRGILAFRSLLLAAIDRQQKGDSTAVSDLDPALTLPAPFYDYVAPGKPGAALLTETDLDVYIYSGEATRSTYGSALADLIRDLSKLRKPLREYQAQPTTTSSLNDVMQQLSEIVPKMQSTPFGAESARHLENLRTHVTGSAPKDSAWAEVAERHLQAAIGALIAYL